MSEQNVLNVTTPTPCFHEVNRDVFEQIIDLTVGVPIGHKSTDRLSQLTRIAKGICGGCPEREQCLTVHGRDDRKLGVVGGKTDQQRADFYGQATA